MCLLELSRDDRSISECGLRRCEGGMVLKVSKKGKKVRKRKETEPPHSLSRISSRHTTAWLKDYKKRGGYEH